MPMPEPLWTLAANVAKQHGLARVARFVRLDYYSLKERIENLEQGSGATSVVKPTFTRRNGGTGSPGSCSFREFRWITAPPRESRRKRY
jgi:hypothetical protein